MYIHANPNPIGKGEEYPGDEYMNEMGYQGRSGNNRYYNGNMYSRGNNYGRYGYNRASGRRGGSYMGNGASGRRYYDGDKENSMNDLRQMLQMEQDPEKRSMLENIMHMLENDK